MKGNTFIKYLYNLSETGFSFEKALISEIKCFLSESNLSGCRVVDFGCGEKPFEYLFDGNRDRCAYYGLDVYPGRTVDVIYNGRDIPIRDSTIDLVFSTSVFEHIVNIEKDLEEIYRILKPGGRLLVVVPFINHVHGVPFDYQRPTRFGWMHLVEKAFGDISRCQIQAVDGRINCIVNMITAQINFGILDVARFIRNLLLGSRKKKLLHEGGASPESRKDLEMMTVYRVLKANPINFILGMLAWGISLFPLERREEGEITSGYLITTQKSK